MNNKLKLCMYYILSYHYYKYTNINLSKMLLFEYIGRQLLTHSELSTNPTSHTIFHRYLPVVLELTIYNFVIII